MATLTNEPYRLLQGGNPYREIPTPNQQLATLIFCMVDLNPFVIMKGLREALGNSYLTLHDFFFFFFSENTLV